MHIDTFLFKKTREKIPNDNNAQHSTWFTYPAEDRRKKDKQKRMKKKKKIFCKIILALD